MSLRARLRLAIVALVTIVVVAISALYLYDFAGLAFDGAASRADLIALQIKGYILETIDQHMAARGPAPLSVEDSKKAWTDIVRSDPYIRGLLQRTTASADVVLSIYIAGEDGKILVSSSPLLVDTAAPRKLTFDEVRARNNFRNIWDLLRSREDYTSTLPLGVAQQSRPVFSITVVIRSVLLEHALKPALRNLALVFLGSLATALFLAFFLPSVVLSPLERVGQRIDRIRTGEFDLLPLGVARETSEFEAVHSKLGLLGQQFRTAKEDALQLRSNIGELLRKIEEAVLLFDSSGRLVIAGHPAARFLGKEDQELVGRDLDDIFPKSTVLGGIINRALETHQPVQDREVAVSPGPGQPERLLLNVEMLRKGPGQPETGMLITLRDAEVHKPLELQLDVSSRLTAIGRLTGGVAHEIKNPLNAIALHLEVLKTKLDAAEPEIDVISREIARLDNVVKTFLNFNRPVELQRQPLDIAEVARGVLEIVQLETSARGIQIQTSLGRPLWIHGDPDLIRQAVLNIVVNAMDAMNGAGTLSVEGQCDQAECVLAISDTGPGIAPEDRDKIFNLYYTTKPSASGMGLAMTFRAVQLHNGTIKVTGGPGQGTTFLLRLPAAESPNHSIALSPGMVGQA